MSSTDFISKSLFIYGGIAIMVTGLIGNIFNLMVFLSLRTFRESSSAFYLIIMSVFSTTQLCFTVSARILIGVYGSDGTNDSIGWCKCRSFLSHYFQMLIVTCLCLVTIDQYCATSSDQRFRKFCQIKIAHHLIRLFSFIWFSHGIPYLIFSNISISSTNQTSCTITNSIYAQYRTYVILLVLSGFLPIFITIIFGSLAFYNVQKSPFYTVPLVRRELDKQLTSMILVQVLFASFQFIPIQIINVLILNINSFSSVYVQAQIRFSYNIALMLFYTHLCVSEQLVARFLFHLELLLI